MSKESTRRPSYIHSRCLDYHSRHHYRHHYLHHYGHEMLNSQIPLEPTFLYQKRFKILDN